MAPRGREWRHKGHLVEAKLIFMVVPGKEFKLRLVNRSKVGPDLVCALSSQYRPYLTLTLY